ncbi:class I SAM-dependent methyltransferase [Streptomyces sp. NPDC026294]|uniref:class I SAM-dependent methyltransferase n=1 Tax=unclassified Streptomyces TaxID=2593676 RepID=UPI0033C08E12
MDPADFCTGLVSESFAPLRSFSPDPEAYTALLREVGGPALERGCGDGDPLLAPRRRGLDVEGVDSSADMLERCRHLADGGSALIPLHVPAPTPADRFGRVRTAPADDGAELRFSVVSAERDERAAEAAGCVRCR